MTEPASYAHWEPIWPGDSVAGVVVRMPEPGAHHGRKLILEDATGAVLVNASARHGHTVLANELDRQAVAPGDRIRVCFDGWQGREGQPSYRRYVVEFLAEGRPR